MDEGQPSKRRSRKGASGEEDQEAESEEAFTPSVKLKRLDDDGVLVTTVVLKESSLSSSLFRILEEERLDVVYENQYRTESKVSHSVLVNLSPGYNLETLRRKLYEWAGKEV